MPSLSVLLGQHSETISRHWLQRRGLRTGHGAEHGLRSRIPGLLCELAQALDAEVSPHSVGSVESGLGHRPAELDLDTVLEEYADLRDSILDLVEAEGAVIGIPEFRVVSEFLSAATAEAVKYRARQQLGRESAATVAARQNEHDAALSREQSATAGILAERDKQHSLFMLAPVAIAILDGPEHRFTFANSAYRALVNGRDVVGKVLHDALPDLRGQGFDVLLSRVMATGETFFGKEVPVELAHHAEGEHLILNFVYTPKRDASGTIDGVLVSATDVTEQVRSRQQLERTLSEMARLNEQLGEAENVLRNLVNNLPELAWAATPNGHIDFYNQRWFDYTGTTLEEMQGWGWQTVHDPEILPQVLERWKGSIATGEPFEMEFPLRGKDGAFRWFLTRVAPLRDSAGNILRWIGTNANIHEQREAGRRAEGASRAKDEFLATASHELRTPLSAILGWARMMRTGNLDASAYARGLETIERNAKIQVQLIEDILDGSRIITGKLHLEIRPLDMTAVVRAALDAVRPALEAKAIQLSLDLDPAAARVTGDPERLQQIVWNLATNAVKFTPKGGSVTIRLQRADTSIELVVSDSGEGISPEFLPHVFERFRQAEGSTTRRHGGLGLGLALVRHLVEAHGGVALAQSDGLGRGARFVVRLPVQAVYAEEALSERPALLETEDAAALSLGKRLEGVRILVVDDEADARDLVATVLSINGGEVTTAGSAAQGLALYATLAPHVIVCDVGMPDVDGYEFIRRVRRASGIQVPAMALTAYSREQDRRLALEAGFQTHVSKPVEPAELVRVVAGLVQFAARQPSTDRGAALDRADTFLKFEKILATGGAREGLRFLNSRTAHRFTALYRFDPPMLRNILFIDSFAPEVEKGDDVPLEQTYCSIIRATERPFTAEDTRRDDRLRAHPARENVISYCGILLRGSDGQVFGSLCHFDLLPSDIPESEMPLMEAVAPLLVRAIQREQLG